jgi:hypothetical protein
MRATCSSSASYWDGSSHFGVSKSSLLGLATLPELDTASTSVTILGSWAKALLFLVVTAERKLDESRDEEENTIDC